MEVERHTGSDRMKAISLLQPWASLVICGAKQIETRSWPTKYRGKLAIHASKSKKGQLGLWEYGVQEPKLDILLQ